MCPPVEFPIGLRILIPFLAALVFAGGPRARTIDSQLAAAQMALQHSQALLEARALARVAGWEPWRVELWQRIGAAAQRGGDNRQAIQAFQKSAEFGLLTSPGQLAYGEAYWANQEFDQALAAWTPLIDAGQAPASVLRRVVQWKRQSGRLEEAFRYAQAWKAAAPQDSQAAYTWDLLAVVTRARASQPELARAAQLDPRLANPVKQLVDLNQRLASEAPTEFYYVDIGRTLGNLSEWDLALAAFQKACELNPAYAEAWAYSGAARLQLHQDGFPDFQKALQLKPLSAAVQAMVGLYYHQVSEFDTALKFLLRAAELEPNNPIWRLEIGNLHADQHDTRAGLAEVQKAIAMQPENPLLWQRLAEYCLSYDLELRPVGLPAARQAVALAPDSAPALDTLGQMLATLGDTNSAERFLQQALEKDPNFQIAALHLGQLYLNQDRWDEAEYYLAMAARSQGQANETNLIATRLLDRYYGQR